MGVPPAHYVGAYADKPGRDAGCWSVATTAGLCSGSFLAGGQHILTAGHCVTGARGTTSMTHATISLMNGTITGTASSYDVNPGWNGTLWAGNDIALIKARHAHQWCHRLCTGRDVMRLWRHRPAGRIRKHRDRNERIYQRDIRHIALRL
jgi:hypothetical protein